MATSMHNEAVVHTELSGLRLPRKLVQRKSRVRVFERLLMRCASEKWDANDDHATFLEALLLSYATVVGAEWQRAHALEMECDLGRRQEPLRGEQDRRLLTQLPVERLVPPSESNRRFEAARAANATLPFKPRVHAHLCLSADTDTTGQHATLIVWTTVKDKAGNLTLILCWYCGAGATISQQWLCKHSAICSRARTCWCWRHAQVACTQQAWDVQ